jgi:hypothetical protein
MNKRSEVRPSIQQRRKTFENINLRSLNTIINRRYSCIPTEKNQDKKQHHSEFINQETQHKKSTDENISFMKEFEADQAQNHLDELAYEAVEFCERFYVGAISLMTEEANELLIEKRIIEVHSQSAALFDHILILGYQDNISDLLATHLIYHRAIEILR